MDGKLITLYDATDDFSIFKDIYVEEEDGKKVMRSLTTPEKKYLKKHNFRVATVALLRPDDVIMAGIACCSGTDSFDKKKGLDLATKRLTDSPVTVGTIKTIKTDSERDRLV